MVGLPKACPTDREANTKAIVKGKLAIPPIANRPPPIARPAPRVNLLCRNTEESAIGTSASALIILTIPSRWFRASLPCLPPPYISISLLLEAAMEESSPIKPKFLTNASTSN